MTDKPAALRLDTSGSTSKPRISHHRAPSLTSPLDVIAKSPTARKMSMSSTFQGGTVMPDESAAGLSQVLEYPRVVAGVFIVLIMLNGVMWSIVFSTSQEPYAEASTSTVGSHPYLARKSNVLNRYFVKYSWAWTSLSFLLHLASAPPSRTSRLSRLVVFGLATLTWAIFTTWFTGNRFPVLSRGSCGITVPVEWGLDRSYLPQLSQSEDALHPMSAISFEPIIPSLLPESFILLLRDAFCSPGLPLTQHTHPSLFRLLKATLTPAILSRTRMPRPRWHRGFDISGHTFVLTLSTMVLTGELATSWKTMWRRGGTGSTLGRGGLVHAVATASGSVIVGIWLLMLGTTAVYYNSPMEKLCGLALGLFITALINAVPSLSPLALEASHPLEHSADEPAEDENSARRGQIVDDGVIVEEDEFDEDLVVRDKPKME